MKLRLPKQLCAALVAAAAVNQTALADYSIDPATNICTITGTQEYVTSTMGTSSEDGTVAQFTLAEKAVFIATGDQFGWGNRTTQARELLMNEGSKVIVNTDSDLRNHRQIGGTTLNGNASFEVNGNVGLNEAGLGANTLTLNNHTLYLTRSEDATHGNEFRLTQTTVSAGTIDVGSGVKLYATSNSTLQSGVMLSVQKNAVAQIDGSYAISTANGPIVVNGGTLQLSTVNTTVDGDRMVAADGSNEAGNAGAFAKLFDGRAVSAVNGGTLVLNGNVFTNNNSKPGSMGSDNLTITGFLELNSQGGIQPTMWNVGSKNLTVGSGTNGGYLWLTNNQKMNVSNGGSVTIGGSLVLAHNGNNATGQYKAAFYAHKATFNAKGVELWGGMNTLALSDSDVTFERTAQNASTNLLVKKGNVANTGTVITLDGNTLHSGTNGWNLTALEGTKLVVSGDTKLDIALGKNITLGGAEISGSFSHADGSAGTLNLTNTTFASTVTSNGANLAFSGTISVGTDLGAYEVYQAGSSAATYSDDNGVNGFLRSTGDTEYYLLKNTGDTKTTIADGVTFSNLTATKQENGDYTFTFNASTLPTDIYYVNSGTVTGAKTGANTYVVANHATLSLQGETVTGKTVILNSGATLASSAGSDINKQQWQSLILKGNATIDTTRGKMGIVGSNWAATNVEFNQHTLTLTGGNIFYIAKATTANGSLYLDNGYAEITKSSYMTLDSVTQNTAKTTNNRLTITESSHVEVLGETNVRQLYVNGAAEAIFDGNVNVNNERVNISGDNTHVTIKSGLNYTGSNNYAVILTDNSTLTFTGETNLNGKFIGQLRSNGKSATVVFASGSDVTSGDIRYSSTLSDNGNIIVEAGATVTSSGKVYATLLENAGTLSVGTEMKATEAIITGGSVTVNGGAGNTSEITNLSMTGGSLIKNGAGTINAILKDAETTLGGKLVNGNTGLLKLTINNNVELTGGYDLGTNVSSSGAASSGRLEFNVAENAVATISGTAAGSAFMDKSGAGELVINSGSVANALYRANGGMLTLKSTATEEAPTQLGAIYLNGGDATLDGGSFIIGGSANTQGLFVGGNAGQLSLKNNAEATVNMHTNTNQDWRFQIEAGETKGVRVESGSTFKVNTNHGETLSVKALGAEDATITASGAKVDYTIGSTNTIIKNADVSLSKDSAATLANTLTNSAITNGGSGALTVSNTENTLVGVNADGGSIVVENAANSASTLDSIKANGGDVTIKGLGDAVKTNLNELFIADNRTVSMYQDASGATEANIAVSGKLTAGSGANLNANLELAQNSSIEIAEGGLHMGSSLTLSGNNIGLSQEMVNTLNDMCDNLLLNNGVANMTVSRGLTLFTGVDSFNGYTEDFSASASNYFDLSGVKRPWDFIVKFEANTAQDGGTVSLWMETPEPATATLSLLALAALAARRKRH